MYKLIAIDLDGTLLNSKGFISEEDKKAIKKAQDNGIEVILASGRSKDSVKNFALEINSNKYLIAGNGALAYDMRKNKDIYDKSIKKRDVLKILKICEDNSIFYSLHTKASILTKSLNYSPLIYHCENLSKPEEKKTSINVIPNLYEYVKSNNREKYLKITIQDADKSIFGNIIKKLKQVRNVDVLEVEHSTKKTIKIANEKELEMQYYYTEITRKNINKWSAIKAVSKKMRIIPKNIVAIGDNINDKEMVENAGLGISMGKSALAAKKIGYVTQKDHNSNGVAEAIEKILH